MTTIFIDTNKRVIVSDTLASGKEGATLKVDKVFKSVCGKFTIAVAGNMYLIHKYLLNKLGIKSGFPDTLGELWLDQHYTTDAKAVLLIVNKYNSVVKKVNIFTEDSTLYHVPEYTTKPISVGSGACYALEDFTYSQDAIKSVIYASTKDKYTNSKVGYTFY